MKSGVSAGGSAGSPGIFAEILQRNAQVLERASIPVKRTQPTAVRFDGFVVETNIHYPTDSSLLLDGLRVLLRLVTALSAETGLSGWRQHRYLLKVGKALHRRIDKAGRSRGKDRDARLQAHYGELLVHVEGIAARCEETLTAVANQEHAGDVLAQMVRDALTQELRERLALTARVCDQTTRRTQQGETVPAAEKLFSLFEPHTEMRNRGKRPDRHRGRAFKVQY